MKLYVHEFGFWKWSETEHVTNVSFVGSFGRLVRRKVRLIEGNFKFLRLKNDLQKDFAAGGYMFEAPSPSRILSCGG